MDWLARQTGARRLALLLLVAILARALTFGNPIVHTDEQFYFVAAWRWLHGALPYVETWDRKPVGLFLLYLPAAALGLPIGIWAYQVMALASVTATAGLIARLADRADWSRGALAGGVAYILWANLLEGQGGQAPIFFNLLMVAAASLIAPGSRRLPPRAAGFAAMALVGLALQIKYSVVFEGVFFGVWLLWREWRAGRRLSILPVGAALIAVALLPTALAWLAFQRIGAGDAWVYANLTSILARQPDAFLEQLGNLAKIILIVSPLLAAAVLAPRIGDRNTREIRHWLFAWFIASALGLLVFGAWFDHYALPLLVPAAICSSGFFADTRARRVLVPLLVVAFVGGQITLWTKRQTRGTPAQFAALAQAIGKGPGGLYVYSGETMLYPATGRCALSRYIFPSHLGRSRETGAIGVHQAAEIDRILQHAPAIVVLQEPYRGERDSARARVIQEMRRVYRLRTALPLGQHTIEIYERSAVSPAISAGSAARSRQGCA